MIFLSPFSFVRSKSVALRSFVGKIVDNLLMIDPPVRLCAVVHIYKLMR